MCDGWLVVEQRCNSGPFTRPMRWRRPPGSASSSVGGVVRKRLGRQDVPFQRGPAWDEFLVDAAGALAGAGLALVDELVWEGHVVASTLWLQRGDWLLGYHRAAERSQMKFGQIFDVLLLQDAIGRGVRTIEMGRGSEAWKYHLGATDVAVCDVVVGHARLATLATMVARVTPFLARRLVGRSASRSSTAGPPPSPRTATPTTPAGPLRRPSRKMGSGEAERPGMSDGVGRQVDEQARGEDDAGVAGRQCQ